MINRFLPYRFLLGLALLLLAGTRDATAQRIAPADLKFIESQQDSLKGLSYRMVFGYQEGDRFHANDSFVRKLVKCLKIKNSFYYPFDSLNISRLYAPDSSFRLFTWQLQKNAYVYLQMGAIQMNEPDGSLKLFPLHDVSMFTGKPDDSVRSNNNWIGAIYYKIIEKEFRKKKYYTLLGFDDFSINANKKWMDVLTFDDQGKPVFGGPYISFRNDTTRRATQDRFNIEYKKEASTTFNYDPELDMIVYDHLISETNEPDKKFTLIPDGSYEGFKWQNGQWVHVYKVFHTKLQNNAFPRASTILDETGKPDEKKLEEASRRNMEKAKQPPGKKKDD